MQAATAEWARSEFRSVFWKQSYCETQKVYIYHVDEIENRAYICDQPSYSSRLSKFEKYVPLEELSIVL